MSSEALIRALNAVLELAAEFDTEDGYTPEPYLKRPVSRGDRIRAVIFAATASTGTPPVSEHSVRKQAREDARQMWNAAFGHDP